MIIGNNRGISNQYNLNKDNRRCQEGKSLDPQVGGSAPAQHTTPRLSTQTHNLTRLNLLRKILTG